MTPSFEFMRLRTDARVAWIEFNRAPVNAFNRNMVEEVRAAIAAATTDPDVRVVALASAIDGYFSAGADLHVFEGMKGATCAAGSQCVMNRLLRSSSKPLLAAINGTAVGGGLEMALHCDLRFAGSNAKLGQPEIRIAFIPPIAVAFVCNQESKYVVVIVAPSPGKFQNQQETVSVAVQRTENNFGSSDLLQQWDNEGNYVFEERPDELDKFTSYLKAQEADGIKSVNFYFPNDLVTGGGTTNQVVIDLSGFSRGLGAFKKKCGDTQ